MHKTVENLINIESNIKSTLKNVKLPKIIAVSKTFDIDKIIPLIEYGHLDFGENKVQEAIEKWTEIKKTNSKVKLHMIGSENQKSGINKNQLNELINFSKKIGLDVIGIMCIPPLNEDPKIYFKEMMKLKELNNFNDLSMGMSADYLEAIKNGSNFVRIGSSIFGPRS